ncbi:MAG: helix-turn-helix transcriptional regulator [Verrucomicrobia bacterium]|jgi:AraC-like DNA-binding protein|nr:helix-turn-helix transcriptional regulator [Verrucomicrobiota bacterium]MBT7067854.1 helix-turn-helix transcriptional regulator [Verrucomicrobiota bacterium]MBT7699806.1 helix-turn-helix transcriptional regulator [Verrucomicrobiota bacterium]
MHNNKILPVDQWAPRVRIANHHRYTRAGRWERVNPDPQLILCINGAVEFGYLDQPAPALLTVEAGEVLFIAPERKHTIQALRDDTVISGIHFEPLADRLFRDVQVQLDPTPSTCTRPGPELPFIQACFIELAALYEGHRTYRDAAMRSLCHHILLRLASLWRSGEGDAAAGPRVEQMLSYIREHYRAPINRQTLGKHFGMTPEHVNYLFKKELGTTPTTVINRERCIRAYALLSRHGRSVKETAYEVGFNDPAYFSRVFRRLMHQPPHDVKPS